MRKIAYNACPGGFGLSEKAILNARKLSGNPNWGGAQMLGDVFEDGSVCTMFSGSVYDISRDDPILIKVIEELGKDANGDYASISIVEIPDDVKWHIAEYNGNEWIAEDHRKWG